MTRKQEKLIAICVVIGIILLSIIVRFITKSEPYNHYLDDKAFTDLQETLGTQEEYRCVLEYPPLIEGDGTWVMERIDLSVYLTDVAFAGYIDNDEDLPQDYIVRVTSDYDSFVLTWDSDIPDRFTCSYNQRLFFIEMPKLSEYLNERYEQNGGR